MQYQNSSVQTKSTLAGVFSLPVLLSFVLSFSTSAQVRIIGSFIDSFGEQLVPSIKIDSSAVWSRDGSFDIQIKSGANITISHIGYFNLGIVGNWKGDSIHLGKIYLIEDKNWVDGPANGFVVGQYPSGAIKYRRGVKNGKLNGVSEFYDKDGNVTLRVQFRKGRPTAIMARTVDKLVPISFQFDMKAQRITIRY